MQCARCNIKRKINLSVTYEGFFCLLQQGSVQHGSRLADSTSPRVDDTTCLFSNSPFPLLLTLNACLDDQSETLHEFSTVLRAGLEFSSSNSEASGHRCLAKLLACTGTVYSEASQKVSWHQQNSLCRSLCQRQMLRHHACTQQQDAFD